VQRRPLGTVAVKKIMSKNLSLSHLLKKDHFPSLNENISEKHLKELQLKILRGQQGVWHQRKRVIIMLEGFDAAGKGGAIRRIVEPLDPRSFQVHPIGAPDVEDQAKHYLYRFWEKIPAPGTLAIFDRSWYGRLLVEKVEGLAPASRIADAYREIRQFEETLIDDGVEIIKIFLAISKSEQLRRFEDRVKDPYKQWKISMDDVRARNQWHEYVKATDKIFTETSTKKSPWHLIAANDKDYARNEVLKLISEKLSPYRHWMEKQSTRGQASSLKKVLRELGVKKSL
jgi:polyphosphate kinase 2 (PPK2 family)